jgi:cell division protein FtsB
VTPPDAPVRSDSFRPVLGATVLLVFVLLAMAGLKSSRDLEASHARERLLEARIAETRARTERLRVRIERLHNDPGMLERLAREDLGLVRPGDVIVELPVAAAPPSATVRAAAPGPPLPEGEEEEKQEGSETSPALPQEGAAVTLPAAAPPPSSVSPPAPELP